MLSLIFSPCELYLFLSNCFFIASFTTSSDFFITSQLLCSPLRKSSNFGNSIFIIRFSFHKCLSKLSSNRICLVATCFLLLYWNYTADNSHNTAKTLQLPDWFIPFVHWFESDILLIISSLYSMPLLSLP